MVSLAQLLQERSRRAGGREDLDHAVELAKHAVAQVGSDAWEKPRILAMLGRLLDERYERGFDPRDRVAAVAAYRRAAVTGLRSDVQWAWQASREWATRAWVSATGLGPRAQLIFVYGRLQSFTPFSQLRPPRSSGFAPLMTCLAMPPISTCVRASPPRRSPHSNVAVPGSALQSSR